MARLELWAESQLGFVAEAWGESEHNRMLRVLVCVECITRVGYAFLVSLIN